MAEYTFCLLDIDYELVNGKAVIRMFGRTKEGKSILVTDKTFEPYFYALLDDGFEDVKKRLLEMKTSEYEIVKVEKVERYYKTKKTELAKVYTKNPTQVREAREAVKRIKGVENYFEADILFGRRYILDKKLEPMTMIKVKGAPFDSPLKVEIAIEMEGEPKQVDDEIPKMNVAAFDIEAYGPGGLPQPETDPMIMLSVATDKIKKVFSTKKGPDFVEVVKDEKGILQAFEKFIEENDIDILTAYNSDNFDMPFINTRAKKFDYKLKLGRDDRGIKQRSKGRYHSAGMTGREHIDLFHYVNIILRGALGQVNKRTLKSVAGHFLKEGEGKKDLDWKKIPIYWKGDKKKLDELYEYSLIDAVVTKKLSDLFLPREYEIAKKVRVPLFDASRTTYGQLVEAYLMWNALERNELIPNRPMSEEKEARAQFEAFEGAFVLEPDKGMHENIALFDFRSLYPTIIISHNIHQSTIDCDCCKGKAKVVAGGHWFCEKRIGLMPAVLRNILEERVKIKEDMKKCKKDSDEYTKLNNMQYTLKILANSSYGYLAYRGSRWYTREGASSVTALGREYIKKIVDIAEKEFDLKAVYGDTDSLFVTTKTEDKKIKEIGKKFQIRANKELPGVMELEFEDLYTRGVFVSKKRYAMIDEKGELKIKGLEFVRKDWSPIAKETQKKTIETLLKEGDVEKAFKVVREVIKKINAGDVTIEDLAVYTDLTRPLDKYLVTAPHIAVAKILKSKGEDIRTGSTIGYAIAEGGGKVSDRAKPLEGFNIKNYDKKYYIEHQIVPAVSRVMEALGYGEDELLGKKQGKLSEYFG
jgi:DNA polymerase elongation subunit (family B)